MNYRQNEEFVRRGPLGEELYKVTEGSKIYYIKRKLSSKAVKNYQLAHTFGFGPPVVAGSDSVKIEGGLSLQEAISKGILSLKSAKEQILCLQKKLQLSMLAHTDVKNDNIFYFPSLGKVLLIDNGELTPYGDARVVKTPGLNTTVVGAGHARGVAGDGTDGKGFELILRNL